MIVALAAMGIFVARWKRRRNPGEPLHSLVAKTKHLYLALPLLLAVACADAFIGTRPDLQWDMPTWLQLHWAELAWGSISGLLAYVFAFCTASVWLVERRGKAVPVGFSLMVLVAIQFYAAWTSRPNLPPLAETRMSSDGVILQTSAYTCVPAAAANIAAILGVQATEQELVKLFHTTHDGTFPAQAIGGMKKIGLIGTKLNATNGIGAVHPPAMLFISGDTHAVVYAKRLGENVEIWNPNSGKTLVPINRLGAVWSGHAIEFERASD